MTTAIEILFVLSLLWLLYIYFGYPIVLYLLSRTANEPEHRPGFEPTVSILTAAYNEVDVIAETIENKLTLDYPSEKLEVIVVSDGSTDGTEEVVNRYVRDQPHRVRLVRQTPRQGKTSGLNLAVPQARGEILVFADANSLYETQALRNLVSGFADESVGYVTGKMIYTNPDGSVVGDGCTAYMRYENVLRAWETRVGSVAGVDGGIDAVRKSLYRPMRADHLPDFVLPLRVIEQGYRVVYEPRAVLRERTLASSSQEYRMRVRVALRALWTLHELRHLLNPLRYPRFSWQLASHKVLRYGAFFPQILALLTNVLLLPNGPVYRVLFAGQVVFYLLVALGYLTSGTRIRIPIATTPYYLTLLNVSCAHAFLKFARGQKQVLWQPRTG